MNDRDKVSTDGLDDGEISFGEKLKSFGNIRILRDWPIHVKTPGGTVHVPDNDCCSD